MPHKNVLKLNKDDGYSQLLFPSTNRSPGQNVLDQYKSSMSITATKRSILSVLNKSVKLKKLVEYYDID